jgi:hypothetical protein
MMHAPPTLLAGLLKTSKSIKCSKANLNALAERAVLVHERVFECCVKCFWNNV